MAINERITTGRKFRRLIDKEAKLWQRISWWTKASDVEFNNGKTAEQKLGNINGITSDLDDNYSDIAASSSSTFRIHDNLEHGIINSHIQFVINEDGTLGWKKDGADTVLNFSSNIADMFVSENIVALKLSQASESENTDYTYQTDSFNGKKNDKYLVVLTTSGGYNGSSIKVQMKIPQGSWKNVDLSYKKHNSPGLYFGVFTAPEDGRYTCRATKHCIINSAVAHHILAVIKLSK